jgi:hypothetical protein
MFSSLLVYRSQWRDRISHYSILTFHTLLFVHILWGSLLWLLFILAVLEFKLRALSLLGRLSAIKAMPPAHFPMVIFAIESLFLPRLAWTVILLF